MDEGPFWNAEILEGNLKFAEGLYKELELHLEYLYSEAKSLESAMTETEDALVAQRKKVLKNRQALMIFRRSCKRNPE
jgi:hypothetical protein